MGRRAQSPELKEARGNPGKRPIAKATPKQVIKRVKLARPGWLTDALAKKVWDQLLDSLHFLRQSDVHVFARYCAYMANWVGADRELSKTGGAVYETSSAHVENMMRINPWFVVRSRLEDDLVKIEEKLGLTPLDRQRIMVGLAAAAGKPFGDLFGGGAGDNEPDTDDTPAGTQALPPPDADVETVGGLRRLN